MSRLTRIAFPVTLLLFAGFFFGGNLGWWSDDYWHCRRDPVTDRVQELVMHRGFFLRPLFYAVVPAVTTALWHHAWAAHAIQLASHAVVVVMLWRLMMMLGIGRRAAGAAAMLFMVYPAQFEAVFWVAALPTSMSSALMLGAMMLGVRFARRESGWWAVAGMGAMTFAACCLNEQPASVAAALPVLAWAGGKAGTQRPQREDGGTQRRAWEWGARMLVPGAVCVLAGVFYVAILRASLSGAPPGVRGSAESLIGLDRVWERTVYFGDVLWRRLVMKNWASGALHEGWQRLQESGWPGRLALAGVTVFGPLWAVAARGVQPQGSARTGPQPDGALGAGAVGLALFLFGWLPILAMAAYEPDSRCRYWPDIGLAMILGAAFHTLGTWTGRWADRRGWVARLLRWCAVTGGRLVLVAGLVVCAVMLIGVQSAFRNRWQMDQREGAELKRLIPDPSPFTMFVPLGVEERALETGSPVLDTHFRSVWEFPWTAQVFPARVYQRSDIRCGYWRHWTRRIPIRGADEAGIHYDDAGMVAPKFPLLPAGTHLVPWDRAVPFIIGRDRVLRIVTRVVLERVGQPDLTIEVPQTRGLPAYQVRLPRL